MHYMVEQSELKNIHIHSLFFTQPHCHLVHSGINVAVPNKTPLGKDLPIQNDHPFLVPFSLCVSHKQQIKLQMNIDVLFSFLVSVAL